jgi:hypothetical protein
MSTQQGFITCSCGQQNSAIAFRCQKCHKLFDGSAGHTIPTSRQVTIPGKTGQASGTVATQSRPIGQSVRFPVVQRAVPRTVASRPEVKVAIVGFSDDADVKQAPAPPHSVRAYHLEPTNSTNEQAGFRKAGEVWSKVPGSRLNIIFLGDGEPTSSDSIFRDPAEAALEVANALKAKGARIATIGCRGPNIDFEHLRALASSPALAWEAQVGNLTPIFLQASNSFTSNLWGQFGSELVVFVIDESGSMAESEKKTQAEQAVAASIEFLKSL